jgi:molecular chaperone DnaK (HSP70)
VIASSRPEELSGFQLQKIKRDAEAFFGEPVKQAVVTVPASTTTSVARRRTRPPSPVSTWSGA